MFGGDRKDRAAHGPWRAMLGAVYRFPDQRNVKSRSQKLVISPSVLFGFGPHAWQLQGKS